VPRRIALPTRHIWLAAFWQLSLYLAISLMSSAARFLSCRPLSAALHLLRRLSAALPLSHRPSPAAHLAARGLI